MKYTLYILLVLCVSLICNHGGLIDSYVLLVPRITIAFSHSWIDNALGVHWMKFLEYYVVLY
jgi:hypothetical protein